MFDKLPSIKDFVAYLIPGILTLCFGFGILNESFELNRYIYAVAKKTDPIYGKIFSESFNLIFVTIFSFLIGFIISQLQIILFRIVKIYNKKSILKNTDLPEELQLKIAEKLRNTFGLSEPLDYIISNLSAADLCNDYIRIYSNEAINTMIDRQKSLSVFATTLFFPSLLGILYFLYLFDFEYKIIYCFSGDYGLKIIWLTFIMSALTLLLICKKINNNFMKGWLSSVYLYFYLFPNKDKP